MKYARFQWDPARQFVALVREYLPDVRRPPRVSMGRNSWERSVWNRQLCPLLR